MTLTVTQLRADLYNLIDQVIETGQALRIDRNGRVVVISAEPQKSKFDRLVERDVVVGDLDELVHTDWTSEWDPTPP